VTIIDKRHISRLMGLAAIIGCVSLCSVGGYAATGAAVFMENMGQAHLTGLGGITTEQGFDAVCGNPAGLAADQGLIIGGTAYHYLESDYTEVQVAWMTSTLGVGIGMINTQLISPQTAQSVLDKRLHETGDPLSYLGRGITIASAYRITPQISLGVAGKWIYETGAGFVGSGVGADIGLQWTPWTWGDFGVVFRNIIAPQMAWDTPSRTVEAVDSAVELGMRYRWLDDRLTTIAEIGYWPKETLTRAGAEYWLSEYIPVWGNVASRGWTIGTGLRLGNSGIDLSYFQPSIDGMEPTYRLGVRIKW